MIWTYLYIGLIVLIIFINLLGIFIKKPNVLNGIDEIKMQILSVLPELIVAVEEPGNGEYKKLMVVKLVHAFLKKAYGLKDCSQLDKFIEDAIENILKTPSKKKEV